MPIIELRQDSESIHIVDGIARYEGSYGDEPIVVTVAIDDLLQAFPELRGEDADSVIRMCLTIETHANEVIQDGRLPERGELAASDGVTPLLLALTQEEIMPPKQKPRF